MGKTRMTAVDLRAASSELSQKLVGQRLLNIYDINPKTYLLKFSSDTDQKQFVVIEVGSRLHMTTFAFDKPQVPSGFTLKVRKHIRQWRLDSLRQLGVDRVVEFNFGSGEHAYRLLVEFYAKGNMILADNAYSIIALVRTHSTEDARYAVRAVYPTQDVQLFRPMTKARMEAAFTDMDNAVGSLSLKAAFTNSTEYGPAFVEHCILKAGLRPNFKKKGAADAGREAADALLEAFQEPDAFLRDIPKPKGYLIRKIKTDTETKKLEGKSEAVDDGDNPATADGDKSATVDGDKPATADGDKPATVDGDKPATVDGGKPAAEEDTTAATEMSRRPPAEAFEDFAPALFQQHVSDSLHVEAFESFNVACDYYFSAFDQQLIQQHNEKSKKAVTTKLEKAMANHRRRVEELEKEQTTHLSKAQLIEDNIDDVDAALSIIRSAIGRAVDWKELARVVKEQKRLGNPVASMIHDLKLDKNKVSLLLTHADETDDTQEAHVIDVDLALSAYANARSYYEQKKKVREKQSKTEAAEGKAMQSATRKAAKEASKKAFVPKKDLSVVRKVLWFEKFNWFISSENYLVIAGRDAQQNEILVRRYLKKGDIYVHADMHGAATTIIKNPTAGPVPCDTLYQAGNLAVCRSSAWDSNIVISAWWVFHHQVSKTAPTGEYMPTGAFMIRGKKNFLPPTKLQMGAGLLWRVHEENVAAHVGERKVLQAQDDACSDKESRMEPSVVPPSIYASEAPSIIRCDKNLLDKYGLRSATYTETENGVVLQPQEAEPDPEPKIEADTTKRNRVASAKERRTMKKKGNDAVTAPSTAEEDGAGENQSAPPTEDAPTEDALTQGAPTEDAPDAECAAETREEVKDKAAAKDTEPKAAAAKKKNTEVLSEAPTRKAKTDGRDASAGSPEEPPPPTMLTRAEKRKQKKVAKFDKTTALKQAKSPQASETKSSAKVQFDDDAAFKKDAKPAPNEEKHVEMELDLLDHLTGQPFEDDLILHPLLMVGPLEAMENFKFKVNILPGKLKKGTAATSVNNHFASNITATDQERQFIKASNPAVDYINSLPSNLRIVSDADFMTGKNKGKFSKGKS
ncbi:Nuclear export mediator factor NEMF-like protein [Diplonema papillatum]|nr:Nuclear export mediator factor NEMF-like protein [Diplonema papillatum]